MNAEIKPILGPHVVSSTIGLHMQPEPGSEPARRHHPRHSAEHIPRASKNI